VGSILSEHIQMTSNHRLVQQQKSWRVYVLLTSPIIRFAVLILLNMWFSNWRSLSIRTPRSFSSVTVQRFRDVTKFKFEFDRFEIRRIVKIRFCRILGKVTFVTQSGSLYM